MASPARITEALPETLPENFVEWDEVSRSPQRVQPGTEEPRPEVEAVSNPATQAAEAQPAAPSRDLPRGPLPGSANGSTGRATALDRAQSTSAATVSSRNVAGPRQAVVPAIDEPRFSAPRLNGAPPAAMTESHGILLHSLAANTLEMTRAAR